MMPLPQIKTSFLNLQTGQPELISLYIYCDQCENYGEKENIFPPIFCFHGNGGTVEPLLYDHPQNHIGVVV